MTTLKKLPGVNAFKRVTIISDASMFNAVDGVKTEPVLVVRHGIAGTQYSPKAEDDKSEISQTVMPTDVRLLQITDSAKLAQGANGLIVEFTFSFLDLCDALHSVAAGKKDDPSLVEEYRNSVKHFIDRAKESEGIDEVALRFARNVLNGRWLWRNRILAESIAIEVESLSSGEKVAESEALKISLHEFNGYSDQEVALGEALAKGLRGQNRESFKVTALITPRGQGAIEVYPSQNYIETKKPKVKGFARSLYAHHAPDASKNAFDHSPKVMGYAAIRDQKIGNALRTIDTWYPSEDDSPKPIAVEPLGANLEEQKFFRLKKSSSFEMLKSLNELDPSTPEGMFIIACLIRGGVYSVGDKDVA